MDRFYRCLLQLPAASREMVYMSSPEKTKLCAAFQEMPDERSVDYRRRNRACRRTQTVVELESLGK